MAATLLVAAAKSMLERNGGKQLEAVVAKALEISRCARHRRRRAIGSGGGGIVLVLSLLDHFDGFCCWLILQVHARKKERRREKEKARRLTEMCVVKCVASCKSTRRLVGQVIAAAAPQPWNFGEGQGTQSGNPRSGDPTLSPRRFSKPRHSTKSRFSSSTHHLKIA